MPSNSRRLTFGWIAAVLYLLSLVLPAVVIIEKPLLGGGAHDETMLGIQCLLLGWVTVPWYANVMLGIAAIGLASRRLDVAGVASFLAVGLALTVVPYLGHDNFIRTLHVGYYAWLASMFMVFVGACVSPNPPDVSA